MNMNGDYITINLTWAELSSAQDGDKAIFDAMWKFGRTSLDFGDFHIEKKDFDSIRWESGRQDDDGDIVIIGKKHVDRQEVPVDMFWDEKEGKLNLPSYADQKVSMNLNVLTLNQVGTIVLNEHNVVYTLVVRPSDWSYSTLVWMEEV